MLPGLQSFQTILEGEEHNYFNLLVLVQVGLAY
jgi:hypothetical protein